MIPKPPWRCTRIAAAPLVLLVATTWSCQPAARMAIEIRPEGGISPPWRVNLSADGAAEMELSGDFLRALHESDPRPAPVTLSFSFKADGPNVDASVFTQDHKILATRSVDQYEFVDLNELATLGYRSLFLRIVPAAPPAQHGFIVSKAPSLRVETISTSQFDCAATITNSSSRDVVGFVLSNGEHGFSDSYSFQGTPVIRANGKTHRYCPFLPSETVVLTAATFKDGYHEGDSPAAARLLAWQIGAITQYRLIAPAIDRVIADPAMNDDQRIAQIKEGIFHLSTEADLATIRALRSRFPDLPVSAPVENLHMGLLMARESIWRWFYPYEQARTEAAPQRTLPAISKLWEAAPDQF